MSIRKYDSNTTTFSPEGRLYQVEYAMECIGHAGAAIGILTQDGIVLAAEKKVFSKLLDHEHSGKHTDTSSEKMAKIDDHVAVAVAGLTSDANILINYARVSAQRYSYTFQEPVPVENLIQMLSDLKQGYTQFGGQRPFGVSFLYGGWDVYMGFQLYHGDPSGNYAAWKAYAIGSNSAAAISMLKQEWKESITLEEAILLALKVLSKTMDSTTLSKDKLEFSTLKLREDNTPYFHIFTEKEMDVYIKKAKEIHEKEERERKKESEGKMEE